MTIGKDRKEIVINKIKDKVWESTASPRIATRKDDVEAFADTTD
jgi:hypothetical protein